ncbi:hypothetical protein J2T17_006593 [Paenibacillus mucilaginosus]|uniref:hypothetical protein n=1 Tax=Paenibacillus mucilaginosus TaxID=61624 RepID=UPI003D1FC590
MAKHLDEQAFEEITKLLKKYDIKSDEVIINFKNRTLSEVAPSKPDDLDALLNLGKDLTPVEKQEWIKGIEEARESW